MKTEEQKYANVLTELTKLLLKTVDDKSDIEEQSKYIDCALEQANEVIEEQKKEIDGLAQELAVTQSQLEEARKRLKRYEGGSK